MSNSKQNLLQHCVEKVSRISRAEFVVGYTVNNELHPSYLELDSETVALNCLDVAANELSLDFVRTVYSTEPCFREQAKIESDDEIASLGHQLPPHVYNLRYIPLTDNHSMFAAVFIINFPKSSLKSSLIDLSPFLAASISLFRSRRNTSTLHKNAIQNAPLRGDNLVETILTHTFHPVIIFTDVFKVIKTNAAAHDFFKQSIDRGWAAADALLQTHLPSLAESIFQSIGRYSYLKHLDRNQWKRCEFKVNQYQHQLVDVLLFDAKVADMQCFGIMINLLHEQPDQHEIHQASIQRFNALTRLLPVAILQFDSARNCTYANETWSKFTGSRQAETLGAGWKKHFEPENLEEIFANAARQFTGDHQEPNKFCLKNVKNGELWVEVSSTGLFTDKYKLTGVIVSLHDITLSKSAAEKLEKLAQTDQLTGLSNRAFFNDRLEVALRRSERHGTSALLFIDLDKFKHINDTYGHAAGDLVIGEVAKRLRQTVRSEDSIARLGGDEFALLLTDVTNELVLPKIASKIVESITIPIDFHGKALYLTCSIGIALCSDGLMSGTEMLRRADLALYKAKDTGRNQYRFYDEALEQNVRLLEALKLDLRSPSNSGFKLVFQPQVNAVTGELVGLEVLSRWTNNEFPQTGPAEFVPKIEENGLLSDFTRWLFSSATSTVSQWQRDSLTNNIKISINLSAKQLHSPNLIDSILPYFADTDLAPSQFTLEVTETALIEEPKQAKKNLLRMRSAGFTISLDDFGTGFASLGVLRDLPLDSIKIDRSFVQDLLTDENDRMIVQAVLGLGQKLKLDVIAEGVEDEDTSNWLINNDCPKQQGYYFYKPLAEDITKTLLQGSIVSKHINIVPFLKD
jgi:diguanylate cyclase (GGDEF)-like protein/PAS domain S-box-containing protein